MKEIDWEFEDEEEFIESDIKTGDWAITKVRPNLSGKLHKRNGYWEIHYSYNKDNWFQLTNVKNIIFHSSIKKEVDIFIKDINYCTITSKKC